ncbi:hypothetical protein MTR67_007767 [Solanum verrucosum]|uniref:DUF4283 domain-containing protein n=1 Tax=Solanum verrucosum TaxID=315347 RepID=A0AAF0Q0D0_SOLVR|nr:hypothetical protein MTR67_007767 [Solanum verrucosum]
MSRHRLTALLSNNVTPATGIPRRLPPTTFGSYLPPGFHSISEESHNSSREEEIQLQLVKEENRNPKKLSLIPIWVMFPGSPVGYWPAKALTKVASAVEIPLHTDNVTANADKISYARVLIEVDFSQPLIELV